MCKKTKRYKINSKGELNRKILYSICGIGIGNPETLKYVYESDNNYLNLKNTGVLDYYYDLDNTY